MPTPETRPWQVRLLNTTGSPVGGGVLIDEEHVLTCAHVVRDALGLPGPEAQAPTGTVLLDFVACEAGPLEATVDGWVDVTHDDRGDVAVLQLTDRVPRGAEPAPVRRSEGLLGHRFDVLGFPRGYDDGLSSSGTVRRPAGGAGEWVELSVPSGTLVERGFSGSPVLDEELGAVVGIIVSSDRDRGHRVAWMIPVRTLARYWPPLEGIARHWSMYPGSEFTSHWSPRSRGVERHSSRGSFFTGRRRAMQDLSDWLTAGRADGRVRAVTGGPGSGKSAVLARLAVLADPVVRPMVTDGHGDDPTPPIDVAVYARGKNTADVLSAITAATGMPSSTVETWVDDVVQRGRPLTVLVDALDEAVDPLETATLLRRTAAVAADGPVKVLVGTRPGYEHELLRQLGSRTVVFDLDDEAYLDRADLAEYVHRRLTSRGGAYENSEESARQVAEAIAARSFPSFLLAQLSTSALALSGPVDVDIAGWQSRFAESVADGWHDYLDRFGEGRRRVQDLLMPLAYAQGSGLGNDDLWPGLASALSGRRYEAPDVEWLLEHATDYLVQEHLQDDRPVYRLYHQTLVEYLRRAGREPELWRRFGRHLVEEVPRRVDGLREWTHARTYTRIHLATHAAEAGILDDLVTDPLFLAVAEPNRLAHALRAATSEIAQAIGPAYMDALPELGPSVDENLNYLTVAAYWNGPPQLAERLGRFEPRVPMRVLWAAPTSAVRSHYLAGTPGGVAAVEPIVFDGHACLAVCAQDGTLRIWDAAGYAPRGPELQPSAAGSAPFLSAGLINGRPVLVTGFHNKLHVVELISATQTISPEIILSFDFVDASITAAAISTVHDLSVVAIGFHDGTVELRRLDGTIESSTDEVHRGPVLSLQFVDDDLVTAGADGTVEHMTVSGTLELEPRFTMTAEDAWANEARLSSTTEHGTVVAAGYADGILAWWRPDSVDESAHVEVNAPSTYGTYQQIFRNGEVVTITTEGSSMDTLDAVVAAELRRREEEEVREHLGRAPIAEPPPATDIGQSVTPGLALPPAQPSPGDSLIPTGRERPDQSEPEEVVFDGEINDAQEREDVWDEALTFRILTLRAGTTSVDVTTLGSGLLLAAGGHDGRVVLVQDKGDAYVLQAEGSSISSVRFVHDAGRCSVVASDRGAGGAVVRWALNTEGAPESEAVGVLHGLPDFMATVRKGTGEPILMTWSVGQDVALWDMQTGAKSIWALIWPATR